MHYLCRDIFEDEQSSLRRLAKGTSHDNLALLCLHNDAMKSVFY